MFKFTACMNTVLRQPRNTAGAPVSSFRAGYYASLLLAVGGWNAHSCGQSAIACCRRVYTHM